MVEMRSSIRVSIDSLLKILYTLARVQYRAEANYVTVIPFFRRFRRISFPMCMNTFATGAGSRPGCVLNVWKRKGAGFIHLLISRYQAFALPTILR